MHHVWVRIGAELYRSYIGALEIGVILGRYDGFAYQGSRDWGEAVMVEAFFDPLCPDSRDAWGSSVLLLSSLPHCPTLSPCEKYYNALTYHKSKAAIDDMAELAVIAIGNSSLPAFLSGFNDPQTNIAALTSFKYGGLRGVNDVPFFFVNGFPLPGAGSALDYNKWRSIIDPLMGVH